MTGQPPGWYPLPDHPASEREWNGDCWIGQARPTMTGRPKGWYPHPTEPGQVQWWTGTNWSQARSARTGRTGPGMGVWILAAIALIAVGVWASVRNNSGGDDSGAVAVAGGQCIEVPASLRDSINSGVDHTTGAQLDPTMWAVKSGDFAQVYFVAGRLTGPGVDSAAVWATNDLDGGGMILAVDGMAQEFSDWGDGGSTDVRLSMSDDGAEQAKRCL